MGLVSRGQADVLGGVVTLVIYGSSILVFCLRLWGKAEWGQWAGGGWLLTALPLGYLLVTAPHFERPPLYVIQVGLMLIFVLVVLLLDYVLQIEFRQTRWAVIAFVMLFFGANGGMLGVAALAGRGWLFAAVPLYLIMGVLAFVQRAVTGM